RRQPICSAKSEARPNPPLREHFTSAIHFLERRALPNSNRSMLVMTNFGKSFSALRSAAVVSFGLLSATGFTSTAIAQDSWTIKWTSYGPQSGVFGESMAQWIDLVETGTEGRVKVQPFYLGALCSVLDGLACAKDGRADMAFI